MVQAQPPVVIPRNRSSTMRGWSHGWSPHSALFSFFIARNAVLCISPPLSPIFAKHDAPTHPLALFSFIHFLYWWAAGTDAQGGSAPSYVVSLFFLSSEASDTKKARFLSKPSQLQIPRGSHCSGSAQCFHDGF